MDNQPLECGAASDAWDAFQREPRTMELDPPGTAHEVALRRFVRGRHPTPNLWTDAWLAAIAESQGAGLTSFDTGFRSFALRDFELLKK